MTEVDADSISESGVCSKEGCSASEGGSCLAGFEDLIDCPDFELTPVEPPTRETNVRRIALSDGEALPAGALESVLRAHPTSYVVPLGRVGTGKTTLVAVIYNLLRSRRLPQWCFSGSDTIIGLARRSHDASVQSGREAPITPRTSSEESGLHLHLGMRSVENGERNPIVLVDLSGEHVADLADGEPAAIVTNALGRADHVPIVIDGRQLADPDSRALAVVEARTLLKMIEKVPLPAGARVFLTITKGDLLAGVDLGDAIDAIKRGTLAEHEDVFTTADRPSAKKHENGEPEVVGGAGVAAVVDRIARRPARPTPMQMSVSRPAASPIIKKIWSAK